MNREQLLVKIKDLTEKTQVMMTEKALELEKEEAAKSELYRWCREQMMLIHQMKYQFLQEIGRIHQEAARLNQETRHEIEKLRK